MKKFYALFISATPFIAIAQNVGVGTSTPQQKLEVAGWVELGNESEGSTGTAGTIRYYTTGKIQFHNGTTWVDLLSTDNSGDYIKNQNSSSQTANFWISGNGQLDGDLTVGGNDLYGVSTGDILFNVNSRGGIRMKLDTDNDGSEDFAVQNGTGFNVFTVTEAGAFTANSNGTLDGNLTLTGTPRTLSSGDAFDISGSSGIDIILDNNNDGTSASFDVKNNGTTNILFSIPEDNRPVSYPYGTSAGNTGGIRFRELAANGSNFIGLRAPDVVGGDYTFTLPGTDGGANQVLITNGTGILSWSNASSVMGSDADANDGLTVSYPDIDLNVNNGLSLNSDNVQLGGTLIQNTTVTQGAYNMVYNLTGTGDFDVQDNGSSALFVRDDGYVGVGTNAPNYNLETLAGGTISVNDGYVRNVRAMYLKDWDDDTGGSDDTYRLLGRDNAWMFYNSGVVVGSYSNGTWASGLGSGNLVVESTAGIGTTTVPKGGVGYAKLAVEGASSSASGPHVQYTTATDNYPLYQQLNWTHDNVALSFDGYYDGAWRSATATGGSFQLYKIGGKLQFNYSNVSTQGSAANYTTGMVMDNTGHISINNNANTDPNSWLYNYRGSTDYGANKAGIYAYRNGTSGAANGGTGWAPYSVDAALKGYSYWGNNYTAGVYGSNYGDYENSAAVMGYMSSGSVYGALGYKDASTSWGMYTNDKAYVGTYLKVGDATTTSTTRYGVFETTWNGTISFDYDGYQYYTIGYFNLPANVPSTVTITKLLWEVDGYHPDGNEDHGIWMQVANNNGGPWYGFFENNEDGFDDIDWHSINTISQSTASGTPIRVRIQDDCCNGDYIVIFNFNIKIYYQYDKAIQTGDIAAAGRIYANSTSDVGDMAEYFPVEDEFEYGDIISFVPGNDNKYIRSSKPYDSFIAGVVSSNPSVVLNNPNSGIPIGLAGRVKVNIAPDSPQIKSGDFLTSSSFPGKARKAEKAGSVIGYAVTNQKPGESFVEILLQPGRYYNPNNAIGEETEEDEPVKKPGRTVDIIQE